MDKEKIKNWVSFPLPEDCQDICILFDRETAMRYVEKFGATPLYGFENNKERWLPVEVFITYGGAGSPRSETSGSTNGSSEHQINDRPTIRSKLPKIPSIPHPSE